MRILLVQRGIGHYRYPFYKALAQRVDLTVLHPRERRGNSSDKFTEIIAPELDFGPVQWQRHALSTGRSFDVVVAPFNVRMLHAVAMPLFYGSSPRLVYWGLGGGRSAAANGVRTVMMNRADAVILYSYRERQRLISKGAVANKLFVAPNTLLVREPANSGSADSRHSLLVVGTLAKRKRIDQVLVSFSKVVHRVAADISVDIVGDGPEAGNLQKLARDLGIGERVKFYGRVTSESDLRPLFERALIAVSPGQAGLSVLHAFANGVPFVTRADAITGGEIEAIVDSVNGFTYKSDSDLPSLLELFSSNRYLSLEMGQAAREYYQTKRTISHMVDGFCQALEAAVSSRI